MRTAQTGKRWGIALAMSVVMMAAFAVAGAPQARAMGGVKTEEAEIMLTQFIMAMNQHLAPKIDAPKAAGLFTVNAVLTHPFGAEGEQRGKDAIQAFFSGLQDQYSAITHVETSRTVQGGRAVWEGTSVAVGKASGDQVRTPVVLVLMFERDGKVSRARVYQNGDAMAQAK